MTTNANSLKANPPTILIVDDDEVDREAICRAFEEARIANETITATNGYEALEILRGDDGNGPLPPPFIVLLDLNMPRMNGIEFLHEIRADERLRMTMVIILSTSSSEKDKLAAYNLNVAGYITKSRASKDFGLLAKLLNAYWRLIEFPPA